MNYHDGTPINLGDFVTVPVPDGTARARVVMLGETYKHLDLDTQFLDWVKNEKQLAPTSIVVEWIDANPFVHDDPRWAPVGNYLFSPVDQWVQRAR